MAEDPFERYESMGVPRPALSNEDLARLLRNEDLERMRLGLTKPEPPEKSIVQRIEEANTGIKKVIADGKLNKGVQVQWALRVRNALKPLYGEKAPLVETLESCRKEMAKNPLATNEFLSRRVEQVDHLLSLLQASVGSSSIVATKNAFIIHGHDELNRRRLSETMRDDFKLNPMVLLDKAGKSAPTIEKFEEHAQTCGFAIALFTRDDTITPKIGEAYWQARPNVIFETGWFVGRLGKERVLILLQEGVEIYSDFAGVNQIPFRENVHDKFRDIKTELEAVGLI